MIAYQRAFIYYHAMRKSQSHVVYPRLDLFNAGNRLQSPHEIPGVLEGGWQNLSLVTPRGVADRDRSHSVSKLNGNLKALYERVKYHEYAWPFQEPVTEDQVITPSSHTPSCNGLIGVRLLATSLSSTIPLT